MRIVTPSEVATQTQNNDLGGLVAAEFVRPVTFEALTGRPVLTSLWERDRALAHIGLAREPDLVIVAPATANVLARAAMGLADDVLTALLLARTGPVLAAPAMNDAMYAHPATRANVKMLAARGWQFVGPETGPLAEGPSDRPGRMSEPEAILAAAERLLLQRAPWQGKSVVGTAGPAPAAPYPLPPPGLEDTPPKRPFRPMTQFLVLLDKKI